MCLIFLPAISISAKFHFSNSFSFLSFLLLTKTIMAIIIMTAVQQLHFYSATWRTSNLKQPIIIYLGEKTHLQNNCSGNSPCVSLSGQHFALLNATCPWVACIHASNKVADILGSIHKKKIIQKIILLKQTYNLSNIILNHVHTVYINNKQTFWWAISRTLSYTVLISPCFLCILRMVFQSKLAYLSILPVHKQDFLNSWHFSLVQSSRVIWSSRAKMSANFNHVLHTNRTLESQTK